MNSYLDKVPNLTSVKVRLSVQSITFFREVPLWLSVGFMMWFCFFTNVWSTLAVETKLAPSHFLFTFQSSEGRAKYIRKKNERKKDNLKNNKDSGRGFSQCYKRRMFPNTILHHFRPLILCRNWFEKNSNTNCLQIWESVNLFSFLVSLTLQVIKCLWFKISLPLLCFELERLKK